MDALDGAQDAKDKFLMLVTRSHPSELLPLTDKKARGLIDSLGTSTHFPDKERFLMERSSQVNQVLVFGRRSSDEKVRVSCCRLQEAYLEQPQVQVIKKSLESSFLFRNDRTLIFVSHDGQWALATTDAYYQKFALNDGGWGNWTSLTLYRNGVCVENSQVNLRELFDVFPVFQKKFNDEMALQSPFLAVLKLLKLGADEQLFVKALDLQKYGYSGAIPSSKTRDIFLSHLVCEGRGLDIVISDAHCQDLLKAYEPDHSLVQPNPHAQAKWQSNVLYYLSIVFMRYASSHYFGTGSEVIEGLRQYALGLMNKAYAIHQANGRCSPIPDARFREIQLTLAGYIATCLGSLSEDLTNYGFNKLDAVYFSVLPPAWR
jgi:hypothetical protein